MAKTKNQRLVLSGSLEPLLKLLPLLSSIQNIELVGIIADSDKDLPAAQKQIFISFDALTSKDLKALQADWLFNFDFPHRFSLELLDFFRAGAMNAHPGLLPKYAGAFPYQWALRNDEAEAGATLHWMTDGTDGGAIALEQTFPITDDDTGLSVYQQTIETSVQLVQNALNLISMGEKLPIMPQDKFKRRYFYPEDSKSCEIDWSISARKIFNFVRAGNFAPHSSPSYVAQTHLFQKTFQIRNCSLGERALGQAGMVSSLKNGTHIVCGDGFTVILGTDTPTPPLKVGDILG